MDWDIDREYCPCDDCGMDCDGWEMRACCTLCAWNAGTSDPDILGCETCTARRIYNDVWHRNDCRRTFGRSCDSCYLRRYGDKAGGAGRWQRLI